MRNGPSTFFLDTNVLVYAYNTTDAQKRARSLEVLGRLGGGQGGALSAQVLGGFLMTVTRKIPQPLTLEEADRSVSHYVRSWVVYDVTEHSVLEAMRAVRQYQLAYWDALIWATAKLNRVPTILSEDFQNGILLEGGWCTRCQRIIRERADPVK
jgi:predicted nucleic acid-binding protein